MKITVLAYLEAGTDEPEVAIQQVSAVLESTGHKVSLLAVHDDVDALVAGLTKNKPELVFNLLESFGKDIIGGQMGVAGILDLLELPYTGSGPGELYLQEDKALGKKLLAYEQILFPDFAMFAPSADFETSGKLRMPLFVKPLRMDASLGIDEKSLVHNMQELMERVVSIHKSFGDAALAEEYIEGREVYVGVLGNQQPVAFPAIEMDFSGLPEGSLAVMDNKAKFDEASDRFQGTRAVLAKLEPELKAKVEKTALAAYRTLRVRDYGRIDLRINESNEIYVIEANANCYLEQTSEFATAAAAHGIEYPDLINQIVEHALERHKQRSTSAKKRRRTAAKAAREAAAPALK